MSLPQLSRYRLALAYRDVDTGEMWFGTRVPVTLPASDDDRFITPNPGERLDQFAYRVLGPQLRDDAVRVKDVIADLNGLVNPFLPLDPSVPLRVPSADRLLLDVFE